jgi:Ca-activated chloride channel family protein
MSSGVDHYQVLGVPRDAVPEEIRFAYFDAARRYHPDANPDPTVREQFLAIQQAYEILANPEKRQEYNASLPPPPPPPKIKIGVRYSRNVIPYLDEPQLIYALIEIACTGVPDPSQYPPLQICLVIDRSTSMAGERMDMVKSNVVQFLRMLKPQDMVSIVTFSDRAEVVVPMGRVVDAAKLENRINMIHTTGGTELFKGLEAGLGQLHGARSSRSVRQLILLTDGHTYGDEKACTILAERAAGEGIMIHALGIGNEWNDSFLDRMTGSTGGNAFFVNSSKDLFRFFDQKLNNLALVYAKGVTLEYTAQPNIQMRYAFRLIPDVGPVQITSPIYLGDLAFGRNVSLLLEFYITYAPSSIKDLRLLDGKIKMQIPSQQESETRLFLNLSRPMGNEPEPELPSSDVLDALSHLSLYRLQERARQEVEEGNMAKATKHLQYLATHLLSLGDRDLAHTVLVEAEHIQQSHQFSKDGDKRIKYGTRALLLPSGMEQK